MDTSTYFNPKSTEKFKFLRDILKMSQLFEFERNEEHCEVTSKILDDEINEELIIKAASIRGFLGWPPSFYTSQLGSGMLAEFTVGFLFTLA